MCSFCHLSATEAKVEMKAALWRIPADFDTAANEDTANAQSLELLTHFDNADSGDIKR